MAAVDREEGVLQLERLEHAERAAMLDDCKSMELEPDNDTRKYLSPAYKY